MGRSKKYFTDDDQKKALRERQKRYYQKNRDTICRRNLASYYDKGMTSDSGSIFQ
jgi:hypothetical protein